MNWQAAIEQTVSGLGYDLVDSERGGRGLLRVYIDRVANDPNGEFITVEDCERVTRQLQHVLEVENVAYERLEVSSPGLDRPLKKPADFDRFAGETVTLSLKLPFQGRKKFQGVLHALAGEGELQEAATPSGWRLVFDEGRGEQALDFAFDEVREARLVPVLDFKGRRFAAPPAAPADVSPRAEGEVDGGHDE